MRQSNKAKQGMVLLGKVEKVYGGGGGGLA